MGPMSRDANGKPYVNGVENVDAELCTPSQHTQSEAKTGPRGRLLKTRIRTRIDSTAPEHSPPEQSLPKFHSLLGPSLSHQHPPAAKSHDSDSDYEPRLRTADWGFKSIINDHRAKGGFAAVAVTVSMGVRV